MTYLNYEMFKEKFPVPCLSTFNHLCRKGDLPAHKVGRHWYVNFDEFERQLSSRDESVAEKIAAKAARNLHFGRAHG